MQLLKYGLELGPVVLASCWAGLRGGRIAAWFALLSAALGVLPLTAGVTDPSDRIHLHMLLACLAAGAYLAGSYTDAQKQAAIEIRRRDRLIYHAERLKSLRAMSVAVIHEVSQPLTTICMEANGLVELSSKAQVDYKEVGAMSRLIARKASDLSELVQRLRRFGESGEQPFTLTSAAAIARDVLDLVRPEANAVGVRLVLQEGADASVNCNEVTLRQALLNLLRNAITASASTGGVVYFGWTSSNRRIEFAVGNVVEAGVRNRQGMGVGLLIARAIARAHGGALHISHNQGEISHTLTIARDPPSEP